MAAVGEHFCLSLDFSSEKLGPDILWFNPPEKYQLRCNGSSGVKILPVRGMLCAARKIEFVVHLRQTSEMISNE